jgi:hypothetical protein
MRITRSFLGLFILAAMALTGYQNCVPGYLAAPSPSPAISSLTGVTGPTTSPDGNYNVTGWTCGSTNILSLIKIFGGASSVDFTISGTNGSLIVNFGSCAETAALVLNFPNTSSVLVVPGATTCSSSCSGSASCTATPAAVSASAETYTTATQGATTVLTRPLSSTDIANTSMPYGKIGCAAGSLETMVLTKD